MAEQYVLKNKTMAEKYILKKQQSWTIYFKETTMAEQWTMYVLKKQQYFKETTMVWTIYFKETTMAEQYILKKRQWLNNIF